jgi:hypothetical protein
MNDGCNYMKGTLSWVEQTGLIMIASRPYFISWVIIMLIQYFYGSKYLKGDLVFGLVDKMRKRKMGVGCMTVNLILSIFLTEVLPVFIVIAWGLAVNSVDNVNWVVGFSVMALGIIINTFNIAFSLWEANKWKLDFVTQVHAYIGIVVLSIYMIGVTLDSSVVSYTSTSAVFLTANFFPMVSLLYLKAQFKDIDVKLLF